jgi:cyclic beta-1,2-glucan synthetase
VALPFVMLWTAAPAMARRISESPPAAGRLPASAEDRLGLRLVARRTWRYFETFVTDADRMLPPDNFQEDPRPVVAHRTSPTNMGLYLLCAVSARDFGWLGTLDSLERLEKTLATTGTTRAIFDRSIRNTFPRSTAAILLPTSPPSPTLCRSGPESRSMPRLDSRALPTQ